MSESKFRQTRNSSDSTPSKFVNKQQNSTDSDNKFRQTRNVNPYETSKFIQKKEEKKPTRYYSKKQENYVAAMVGGKTTPNSGATLLEKGDITTKNNSGWIIECKTKTSKSESITIKKEWLKKLKEEAVFMHKRNQALIFNFGPDTENYAIIDMDLFNTLKEYLESLEEEQ